MSGTISVIQFNYTRIPMVLQYSIAPAFRLGFSSGLIWALATLQLHYQLWTNLQS